MWTGTQVRAGSIRWTTTDDAGGPASAGAPIGSVLDAVAVIRIMTRKELARAARVVLRVLLTVVGGVVMGVPLEVDVVQDRPDQMSARRVELLNGRPGRVPARL